MNEDIMEEEQRQKILSNDYVDLIIEYSGSADIMKQYEKDTILYVDNKYAIVYAPLAASLLDQTDFYSYSIIPKLYGLLDTTALEEMGVYKLQSTSVLSLRGKGVLLGFLDTGIDYTNPVFQYEDGTTRIFSLWDQTIEVGRQSYDAYFYGTEYRRSEINEALKNENPFSVVPSVDEDGHGTRLAGLAGGRTGDNGGFSGVATDAEYIVVKLRGAKTHLKGHFGVKEGVPCYAESDIMLALRYLVSVAQESGRPIAVCIGIGTNQGGHEGMGAFNDMVSSFANTAGICIVVAAGNEGNIGHHFFGEIDNKIGFHNVELQVGKDEVDFSMELWGNVPGVYSLDILSPTGEYVSRIPARLGGKKRIAFLFEPTVIYLNYILTESKSGDQLILLRFKNPTQGIWKFRIYGGRITSGFHIWLPIRGFITDQTYFLSPNPETTITVPGDNLFAITVSAYNHKTKNIYVDGSRGYTRYNIIKPEAVAPGVNILSPIPGGGGGEATGTSLSAAFVTGVGALLLEWGMVKGNDKTINTVKIKRHIIRGSVRTENITYPSKEWGYGMINVYGVFESLRSDF